MLSDALSETLSRVRPSNCLSAGLRAGGDWCLRFGAPQGIKFNAILSGSAWLWVESEERMRLEEGDCFLLTRQQAFFLGSDPHIPPDDAEPIYEAATDGIARCGTGDNFFLIGGRFAFEDQFARVIFDPLPPIVKVSTTAPEAAVLKWALLELKRELAEWAPGGALMTDYLGQIMLLQTLRLHARTSTRRGLVYALSDPRIAKAANLIHREPEQPLTLQRLAAEAGMSRSSFAARFSELLGLPPAAYIRTWRMILAQQMLKTRDLPLAEIAERVGYGSVSAFSVAFADETGLPPSRWRQRHVAQENGHAD